MRVCSQSLGLFSRLAGLFGPFGRRGVLGALRALPFAVWVGLSSSGSAAPAAFFIAEYRVHGAHALTPLEIETVIYPFLGPERTEDDIKAACAALEKAYQSKGFGAATVTYKPNLDKGGVIHLTVTEGTVGRLRVTGARYFSPERIKAQAPSLAEGKVINFNDVNKDVVALNQLQDRVVTPTLQPGTEPGTYDITLGVKDSSPAHASIELNNHYSANTTPLRVSGAVNDSNLFQSGQGAGLSFQEAPERPKDSEVFSAYYLARFSGADRLSVMLQGTKLDSNISTLGGSTVAGPGETLEIRLNYSLPTGKDWSSGKDWENFSQSVNLSFDFKHFQQSLQTGSASTTPAIVTPITYYPLSAGYSATLNGFGGKTSVTEFNAGVTFHFRGLGSGPQVFNLNRYGADGGFVIVRGGLSHTQDLPGGSQLFARVQGQLANQPLVSSEESSGGGVETVRGYLESEAVGDDGAFASLELRTASILSSPSRPGSEVRLYVFGDTGHLSLIDPLPEQTSRFTMTSVGFGTRMLLNNHLNGECDAAYPLDAGTYTQLHDVRVTFRVGLEF